MPSDKTSVAVGLSGTAFFFAGLARARSVVHNIWPHGLLVSCPGLLGTAALIMNDGFHRLLVPVCLALTAVLLTVAGIETRREWPRSRREGWVLAFASFAALAVVSTAAIPFRSAHASVKLMDRSAPSFVLSRLDGTPLRSSDMRGHVVVLAFWATWCLPCQRELPELESVYKRYQGDAGVIFVAVDADWGGETAAKAQDFLRR
jgi:thiol-disulfide isomerase/thioredoxin